MSIIQINNRGIHVLEMNRGASETIVMIHGMFSNMSVFYFKIAPVLANHYHIVMYDLKSHGKSERSNEGYDLASMSEDLIAIMDHLELEKVHLVGYSYGGLIALYASMFYPERINKLVIIESPRPDEGDATELMQRYKKEYVDRYLHNYKESTSLLPGKRQLEKNKEFQEFLLYKTTIREDLDMDNNVLDNLTNHPVKSPLLLLYGSGSDCVSGGDYLSQIFQDSLLMKEEGDHNLPVQKPQWISDKIIDFLKS